MIDLHTHSTASDGSLAPSRLVEEAAERGLSAIALTDHDTMAGIPEAEETARRVGIRFIPGVEMEIAWEPGEFHLLALGIYSPSPEFKAKLQELAVGREERNRRILELMGEMGVEADYAEVEAYAAGKVVGRPHFASFLVERRVAKNRQQAFDRYLGKGRPFYAPKPALELEEAIRLVKGSGGTAILAHPLSLYVAWGRFPALLEDLKAKGLDGLEAWHPTAKVRACERLETMARSLGFVVTAGSDFHGEARPDRKLGITSGGRKIDERYLEGLPLPPSARRMS